MLNIHPIHQTLKLGLEQASQSYQNESWLFYENQPDIHVILKSLDGEWVLRTTVM